MTYLLGIDQGTTGTSVLAFDQGLSPVAKAYRRIHSHHPQPGWVEQDPEALIQSVAEAVAEVLAQIGGARQVLAAGVANQGESVVAWDALTGRAITPVLVWSDRRASGLVEKLLKDGHGPRVRELTGLELSDYFCAAKYAWLLQHDHGVQSAAKSGRLRLGTLDAWMAYCLGGIHCTDTSTASRTQLLGIQAGQWEPDLLNLFDIPAEVLPPLKPSLNHWGNLHHRSWEGELPWFASLVDQPASLAGNGCIKPGQSKITYGTGCFAYVQAGTTVPAPGESLLASVAWSQTNERTFSLDGGVFTAGTAIDWLVELGLAKSPAETAALAESAQGGVYFLPAFTGIGAPWWKAEARGVLAGLTAGAGRAELVRGVLEGIGYRVCDVVQAIQAHVQPTSIRVDGGLTQNRFLMQFQADLLGIPLEVSAQTEATAFGAAMLAGLSAGTLEPKQVEGAFKARVIYEPRWSQDERETKYAGWLNWLRKAWHL
jgi:glycerol kinase